MAILGTILFGVMFLFLASGPRKMIFGVLTGAGDWVDMWAPYSYVALAVVVLVPAIAAIVLIKWPQPPEPENPLARYKDAADVLED